MQISCLNNFFTLTTKGQKEILLLELVYIFRKILLILIDIFFVDVYSLSNNNRPLTFLILTCLSYTVFLSINLNLRKNPYDKKYPTLNKIEILYLNLQALMCWLGCLLLSFKGDESSLKDYLITYLAYAMVFLGNLYAIFMWRYYFWIFSAKKNSPNF